MGDWFRYPREWSRFADWCAATDRSALPSTPGTVLAYLDDERPTGGTAARWVAGIRAMHMQNGHRDPRDGAVADWVRRARRGTDFGDSPDRAMAARVAAGDLPVAGWPIGVFGRRDRLAVLLNYVEGVPVHLLVGLPAAAVRIAVGGAVTVDLPGGELSQPADADGDPRWCVGCAAVLWLRVLRFASRYPASRALAQQMTVAKPLAGHACMSGGVDLAAAERWPLFQPIDRWGARPLPPEPMSQRAMGTVLRDALRGRNTHADRPVLAPDPPADPDPPAAPRRTAEQVAAVHQAGLKARSAAKTQLAGIAATLDEVDAAAAALSERMAVLLAAQ